MTASVLFVTGVSGSGKTTVGQLAAAALGWFFADGDAFHPTANVEKMRSGQPLDDLDRAGWLAAIRLFVLQKMEKGEPTVIACSALKQIYRDKLAEGLPPERVFWAHLVGDFDLILGRISARKGHFMPPALLRSQFEIWEKPSSGLLLDAGREAEDLVLEIKKWIAGGAAF